MKGTPGAISFARRRASIPSKPGMEKSDRIAWGRCKLRARFSSSSTSTHSQETSNPPCSSARNVSSTSISESSMKSTWIGVLSMHLLLDRRGIGSLLPFDRQREKEHRPLAHFRLGPDAPAMPVHDALNGCKPDSRAGIVSRGVQALKRAKKLVGEGHVEARPVVAHKKGGAAVILQCADFDVGLVGLRGEL